jgi:hypothetical protein
VPPPICVTPACMQAPSGRRSRDHRSQANAQANELVGRDAAVRLGRGRRCRPGAWPQGAFVGRTAGARPGYRMGAQVVVAPLPAGRGPDGPLAAGAFYPSSRTGR